MKLFAKFFVFALAFVALGCNSKPNGLDFAKEIAEEERPAMQEILDKATAGDSQAQSYLGILFYTGSIGRDHASAYAWFKKASENGSGEADYFIHEMYDKGIYLDKDSEAAFKYLQWSALKGFTSARLKLAEMYLAGERKEDLDRKEILEWLGEYAEERNERAMKLVEEFQKLKEAGEKAAAEKATAEPEAGKKDTEKQESADKTADEKEAPTKK